MFGKRRKELERIIPKETGKLSPKGNAKHRILQPYVVTGNPPKTFIPLSDAEYKLFSAGDKSFNDHDIRVRYIHSREIEALP